MGKAHPIEESENTFSPTERRRQNNLIKRRILAIEANLINRRGGSPAIFRIDTEGRSEHNYQG
jgi:hypothetical protein